MTFLYLHDILCKIENPCGARGYQWVRTAVSPTGETRAGKTPCRKERDIIMDDFEKKFPDDTPNDDTVIKDAAEELEKVLEEDDCEEAAEEGDFYEKVSGKKAKPDAQEGKKGSILKPLLIIGGALVLIAAGLLFYFTVFPIAQKTDDTFMTVNGTKVSREEIALMAMLVENNDINTAISIFEEYIVLIDKAKEYNITLTDESKAEIDAMFDQMKALIAEQEYKMPDVSDERLRELVSVRYLSNGLYKELTKDYVIDEEHFESELYVYENDYPHYYIDMDMKYIFTQTYEDAEDARAMLAAGADVDEVIEMYSAAFPDEGVVTVKLVELVNYGYVDDEWARSLVTLNAGEWSETVALSDEFYVVLFVVNKASPSKEELREAFREMYSTQIRNEEFDVIYMEWIEGIDSVMNQTAFDEFDLTVYKLDAVS